MAKDLNRSIKIFLDNTSAMTSADQLEGKIGDLEKKLLDLQTAGQGNSKQAKTLEKELKAQTEKLEGYKQKVAETERVVRNLSGATYDELIGAKRELDKQLKKTTRGTDEYNQKLILHKQLGKEIAIVQRDMRTELGCQSTMWGRSADFINKYMGLIGSAVAGITGITMAFNKLREERNKQEESKADVKALTGLDDESIEWLTIQAKQLSTTVTKEGIRIRQSATEILEAYKLVGSAKPELLENKEALAAVTEQTLILASASGMKLTDAVDAVTLAMNQYGAGADEAAKYVNALAAGSKFGAVAVESQTSAITKSGVSAAAANIPIEQLIGTIETLGEKGIKDEIAGTGLKKFFLTLQTGANETNPKVVGLTTALENLRKKQMDAAAVKKMFGEEGYNVASVLINEADKVDYYTKAVTGTSVAMEQAAIKSETAASKMDQARNKMTNMGIELMEKLNPTITGVMNQTVHWTGKLLTMADWLSKNGKLVVSLATVLGLYTAAIKLNTYWTTLKGKATSEATRKELLSQVTVRASIAADYAAATAKALLAGNIKAATVAMRGFLVTLGLNPVVAIGIAIAALTVGIYKLCTRTTEADKVMKSFFESSIKEQTELDKLYRALKRSGEGTELRTKLLGEFNTKYGEYLPNLLSENATLGDIETAYRNVTIAMKENLAQKTLDKGTEDIEQTALENKANLLLNIKEKMADLPESVVRDALGAITKLTDKGVEAGLDMDTTWKSVLERIRKEFYGGDNKSLSWANDLDEYVKKVYETAGKVNDLRDKLNPFLPKKVKSEKPANELEEVVVTPDRKSTTPVGTKTKDSEFKSEMNLVLKQLDIKHTEELTRLKKFKLDSNQTEAAYNSDLRKEEMAHYAARAKLLQAFKAKVSDKKMRTEIDKMIAEDENKVIDSQLKYQEAINKILLDANPLDKEKAAYEERLREVGLFGIEVENLTEEQKKALELLEKQHQDAVLKIKRDADKEKQQQAEDAFKKEFKERKSQMEIEYDREFSSLEMMKDFDFIPEELTYQKQLNLAQKKIDLLKSEADARRKFGLDTIKIQEGIAVAEQDLTKLMITEYQKRWSKYKAFAVDMGSMLGDVIAGSENALADMGIYLINMGLDMLKKQLQLAAAQAMGWSLASPESILTMGVAGIAKALAVQALIEGVFAAAKSAIKGSLKSSKSSMSLSSTSNESSSPQTGSRVVTETGWFNGGSTGLGNPLEVAGPVHYNEYVVPAWEMQEPIAVNHVLALEAIRRQRTNANPLPAVTGFADGGYNGRMDDGNINMSNLELLGILNQLSDALSGLKNQPLKAYVVYSDYQATQAMLDRSKKIGSKS